MGAGKTTFGNLLAKMDGLEFIDLDLFIESRYNKTIGKLFEEKGEAAFREIESAALREVSEFENVVVSTGGGTPCFFDNMALMNEKGTTIYLKVLPEILAVRLNKYKDKRPLIRDKNEAELLSFISDTLSNREQFYNRSVIIFDTKEVESQEETEQLLIDLQSEIDVIYKNSERNITES